MHKPKLAMAVTLLFHLALLSGCGGSSGPSGPCVARKGSYRVTFVERSGNCGATSEIVVVVGGSTSTAAAATCSGTNTASADNCAVTEDETCNGVVTRGVIHWSEAGDTGGGILQFTTSTCSSSYDVAYTRL
jgi:hypothetical protein